MYMKTNKKLFYAIIVIAVIIVAVIICNRRIEKKRQERIDAPESRGIVVPQKNENFLKKKDWLKKMNIQQYDITK